MTTKRLPATLMLSHKTGQIYILTKYRRHPNGNVTAFEKYNATHDFAAIVDALPVSKDARDAVLAAIKVARKADIEAASKPPPAPDLVEDPIDAAVDATPLEGEAGGQ